MKWVTANPRPDLPLCRSLPNLAHQKAESALIQFRFFTTVSRPLLTVKQGQFSYYGQRIILFVD